MILHEYIRFLMPEDRELQFAALPVVQIYVNDYADRMRRLDPSPQDKNTYKLHYALEMPEEDKRFFAGLGLRLEQDDEELPEHVDAVYDFGPERINRFDNGFRPYTHGCAIQCGVSASTLPGITQIKPRKANRSQTWHWSDGVYCPFQDEEITGVVVRQSWVSYAYAAQGLPVIEILPKDRSRAWLGKWSNPYYRMVLEGDTAPDQIRQAMDNLRDLLKQEIDVAPERPLARAG